MNRPETFYTADRTVWRQYLAERFETESEIWLVYPMKGSGEESILYNDAVEEALCFGWIDSTIRHTDELHRAQRFTPRRKGSPYSQPNIERLRWLEAQSMLHSSVRESVLPLINAPFVYPKDILAEIAKDPVCQKNFDAFPEPYKRIRVAYIDAARKRPGEFEKRLARFVSKTKQNKRIMGYGGVEKYYF